MADFTRSEGYAIGPLFSDVRDRGESGLYGLAEYLRRGDMVAVVVFDVSHLTHGGCLAGADRRTAQRFLRVRVLAVDPGVGAGVPL
jgi:hypothetical protein